MKELDDAIEAYRRKHGFSPDTAFVGRKQFDLLYEEDRHMPRGYPYYKAVKIVRVDEEDYTHITSTY